VALVAVTTDTVVGVAIPWMTTTGGGDVPSDGGLVAAAVWLDPHPAMTPASVARQAMR
jgi:hypothetical protein